MEKELGPSGGPATLEAIRANLLEARIHVHFNIGSPQAIDHLLVSIVALIDALLEERK